MPPSSPIIIIQVVFAPTPGLASAEFHSSKQQVDALLRLEGSVHMPSFSGILQPDHYLRSDLKSWLASDLEIEKRVCASLFNVFWASLSLLFFSFVPCMYMCAHAYTHVYTHV